MTTFSTSPETAGTPFQVDVCPVLPQFSKWSLADSERQGGKLAGIKSFFLGFPSGNKGKHWEGVLPTSVSF